MLRVNKREYDHFVKNKNLLDSIKYLLYTRKEEHTRHKHKEIKGNHDHGLKQLEIIERDMKELEESKAQLEKEIGRIRYTILHDDKAAGKVQYIEEQNKNKQIDLQARLKQNQNEIVGYEKFEIDQVQHKTELKKLQAAKLELLSQKHVLETQIGIMAKMGKGGPSTDVFRQDIKILKSEVIDVNDKIEAINNEISKILVEDNRSSELLLKLSGELETAYESVSRQSVRVQEHYSRLSNFEAERSKIQNVISSCERELNSKYFGTRVTKFGDDSKKTYSGAQLYSMNRLIENYRSKYPNKYISLVIDTVMIPDNLLLAFESLCSNKLFSVIVETFGDAENLIELNRELKGGKLVVYVLEDYQRRKRQDKDIDEQSQADYICLFKYLNLHPNLTQNASSTFLGRNGRNSMQVERDANITMDDLSEMQHNSTLNLNTTSISVDCLYNLLHTLFSACYLVKTPELAASFANKYKIDTVTAEGDVFYSGGYITKVGYHKKNNRIALYYEIKTIEIEVERLRLDFERSESNYKTQQEICDNEGRELQHLEQQNSDLEARLRILKETGRSLKLRVLQLEKSLFDYEKFRIQKLKAMEEKQKLLSNPESYKLAHNDTGALEKGLGAVNKKLQDLNDQLSSFELSLAKTKQAYDKPKDSVSTVKKIRPEKTVRRTSAMTDRLRAKKDELEDLEDILDKKTREVHEIHKVQLAKREELKNSEVILAKLQYKIDKLREKAELAEQYSNLSSKRLIDELKKLTTSTNHYFTEKDAVIFKKLSFINEKQHVYTNLLHSVEQGKQTVFNSFG